jgi:hypothetical protein
MSVITSMNTRCQVDSSHVWYLPGPSVKYVAQVSSILTSLVAFLSSSVQMLT